MCNKYVGKLLYLGFTYRVNCLLGIALCLIDKTKKKTLLLEKMFFLREGGGLLKKLSEIVYVTNILY